MQRPYRVGRSCVSWCTLCRSEMQHTIIAMVEDSPKRVECDSCHSQHNYRLAPGGRKQAARKASGSSRIGRKNTRWERLVPTDDNPEARLYSLTERFEKDEVLAHKSLGIGIVQQVQPGNKIEVLFESGKKLLVHGR